MADELEREADKLAARVERMMGHELVGGKAQKLRLRLVAGLIRYRFGAKDAAAMRELLRLAIRDLARLHLEARTKSPLPTTADDPNEN